MRILIALCFAFTLAAPSMGMMIGRVDSFAKPGPPLSWMKPVHIPASVWNDGVWHIAVMPPGAEAGNPLIRGASSDGPCATLILCLRAIGEWQAATPDHAPRVLLIEFPGGEGEGKGWPGSVVGAQIEAGTSTLRLSDTFTPQSGHILIIVKSAHEFGPPVLNANHPEGSLVLDMRREFSLKALAEAVTQPGFTIAHHTGHFSGWSVGDVVQFAPDAMIVERDLIASLQRD